jgi:Asp-tRNA(Asn)/Glu-tRNA(Gln) amidotransferase C subunit
MSYVRSRSIEKIDPETVQALAQIVGLDLATESLDNLALSLASQLASMKSVEQLDLTGIVPAVHMDPRWPE